MGVLHEEVLDRIAAIADPSPWLRREMKAGDITPPRAMMRGINTLFSKTCLRREVARHDHHRLGRDRSPAMIAGRDAPAAGRASAGCVA
jgi:hypothetical protein